MSLQSGVKTTASVAVSAAASGIAIEHLTAGFGDFTAVKDISLPIQPHTVTAIIGPSGCGKSTFLRCLNLMHDEVRRAWVRGTVELNGEDIRGPNADRVKIRRKIGMVFQKPNPFPTRSIAENVAAGLRLNHWGHIPNLDERIEHALRMAALWDEVKDKLDQPGIALSGGQQQRLCIARALAVEPEVLLMDEPASALDPIATYKIEDLIRDLSRRLHHYHCHTQYAAGDSGFGQNRLFPHG